MKASGNNTNVTPTPPTPRAPADTQGWWHSEFNRFRYDVELVVGPTSEAALTPPTLQRRSHAEACAHLGLPCIDEQAPGASVMYRRAWYWGARISTRLVLAAAF